MRSMREPKSRPTYLGKYDLSKLGTHASIRHHEFINLRETKRGARKGGFGGLAESETKDGEVELLLLRIGFLDFNNEEATVVLDSFATTFGEEGISTIVPELENNH